MHECEKKRRIRSSPECDTRGRLTAFGRVDLVAHSTFSVAAEPSSSGGNIPSREACSAKSASGPRSSAESEASAPSLRFEVVVRPLCTICVGDAARARVVVAGTRPERLRGCASESLIDAAAAPPPNDRRALRAAVVFAARAARAAAVEEAPASDRARAFDAAAAVRGGFCGTAGGSWGLERASGTGVCSSADRASPKAEGNSGGPFVLSSEGRW